MAKPLPIILLLFASILNISRTASLDTSTPTPAPWPLQFHSVLYMTSKDSLSLIDLWYDWPNGRNFNIIHDQLGDTLYDLEWNNGTTFAYNLGEGAQQKCWSNQLDVGILRPYWLDGANYLGRKSVFGFECNVWEKADFITYYEDVVSKRPVYWVFYTGRAATVMTFEVGAILEDAKWQAPEYCFKKKEGSEPEFESISSGVFEMRLMKSGSSNSKYLQSKLMRKLRDNCDGIQGLHILQRYLTFLISCQHLQPKQNYFLCCEYGNNWHVAASLVHFYFVLGGNLCCEFIYLCKRN